MKRLISTLLLLVALAAAAAAQTRPASEDVRRETFEIVWRTVKEKHFDPTFGGVDWDKVHEQYAPRVAAVKSDAELYGVLQQMLGELHQSHFNILPPEAIAAADSKEVKEGGIGIDLRYVDNQIVVTKVAPGSKAAAAGIRPGFVITKIDDTTVEQIVERLARGKLQPSTRNLYIAAATLARISGEPGTKVRLAYLDADDHPVEVAVERERLPGEMSQAFGNLPPQRMEFESKRLAGGVGYIRFNIFLIPMMEKIRAAIKGMSDAPGIIIDLRGNPGGIGAMANGIAGMLETKEFSLGVMRMRALPLSFVVHPRPDPYLGPVVILMDGSSASTSEVFAAGMQEAGRARVVGETSAGAALPSVLQKLPTGAVLQYAIADYKTPKGTLIEGRGVIPDVVVKLTRRELLKGRDPQLEAAIQQIKNNRQSAVSR